MRGVLSKSNGNHYLLDVLLDVADSITYSRDLLGLIVGNSDLELLFKFHDELYSVERVSTEVVGEACFVRYFSFINAQFVTDDFFYFCFNIRQFLNLNLLVNVLVSFFWLQK